MSLVYEPGITVVMPVYNVSEFIERSLGSVLKSSFKNLKVIIVDDCGTDDSMDIIRHMICKDPRVTIIKNKQNGGLAFSRNVGIKHVTTEYTAFLDSDDWVAPDFYEKLYKSIVQENADIAIGNVLYTYPEKEICREEWVSWWTFRSGKPLIDSVRDKQYIIYACACWNKLYRTELIHKNSLEFPVGLFVEDVPFTFAATALANRIVLVRNAQHFYLQRSNSIMKDLRQSRRVFDIFKINEICYQWLRRLPVSVQPEYRQVLDHFIIFNLESWSKAVRPEDYKEFFGLMKSSLLKVDISNNPYVTAENRAIYESIVNTDCLFLIKLFGLIPIGKIKLNPFIGTR